MHTSGGPKGAVQGPACAWQRLLLAQAKRLLTRTLPDIAPRPGLCAPLQGGGERR